ncbi:hypothetical protein V497_07605 [Pseudogymnoascus sp. VKM F-4516 (FW-969)]|nr:hypothetical protein V497_07605 [Pseudogymnoascus sp. VKM F-4516 (FW-969)]
MTRPQIIRADTIDLQDQGAPSAKDHTRQPTHPSAIGAGPPAPHQAGAIRNVVEENERQQHPSTSPNWANADDSDNDDSDAIEPVSNGGYHNQHGAHGSQNGGSNAEDADMADAEGDDSLDEDDMMDKISSSPSIDDGGFSSPLSSWPLGYNNSTTTSMSYSSLADEASLVSSSPYRDHPAFFPSVPLVIEPSFVHRLGKSHLQVSVNSLTAIARVWEEESSYEASDPGYVEAYDDDYDYDPYNSDDVFAVHSESATDSSDGSEDLYDDNLCFPCESSDEGDDEFPYPEDPRFIDSGWGGECLQDTEDIDFEFVYALHTFVATVEGQANATKGDTMVLLDDSNSYWWLVRVVKDSSIGYLPAEHIETPTERLARLNKHRNIDLSATMLGDQADKPKNPLKKAIRRRNAKNVTFNQTHTYVEASDVEYSSDEEDGENAYFAYHDEKTEEENAAAKEEEASTTEPDSEKAATRDIKAGATDDDSDTGGDANGDATRTSDEIFEGRPDGVSKSRNGTVRNTDSFFKDDTVETRKITITPNILRDDSSASTTRASSESKEARERRSLDKLEKDSASDKAKDKKAVKEKKDKDKKPGMLSGLFKRKDKKSKSTDEDGDDMVIGPGKASSERTTSPAPSRDSEEVSAAPVDDAASARGRNGSPQRHPSKLQKMRAEAPSKLGKHDNDDISQTQTEPQTTLERSASAAGKDTMRLVQPDGATVLAPAGTTTTTITSEAPKPVNETPKTTAVGAITKILRSRSDSEPKPERLKKAKARLELDDSDSPVEATTASKPVRPIPGAFPDSYASTRSDDTLTAPTEAAEEPPSRAHPPALVGGDSSSPESSPSPELGTSDAMMKSSDTAAPASTRTSASTWSDSQLRSFFDDGADVRDLLVVVYDKTGVEPAGPEHPLVGGLFRAEEARVRDLGLRLDNMLGDWLARKRTVTTR